MVGTCLRAKAAAPAGASAVSVSSVDDASNWMELLQGEVAVQNSGFRRCLELSPGSGTGIRPACRRCAQVEDILQQVGELQEAARRLRSIREAEELDTWFQAQAAAKQPKTPPVTHKEQRGTNNEGE